MEQRAAATQTGDIAGSIELPYFYIGPNVARVDLALETPTDALKFEKQKGKLHAEMDLLGIATAADGRVGARFSDTLKFDFDNQAEIEKLKEKPLQLHQGVQNRSRPVQFYDGIQFRRPEFRKAGNAAGCAPRKTGELALSGLVLSKEVHPAGDLGVGLGVSTGDQNSAGCARRPGDPDWLQSIHEIGRSVFLL